jgi:hypothetical protein
MKHKMKWVLIHQVSKQNENNIYNNGVRPYVV